MSQFPNGHVADLADDFVHELLDEARAAEVVRHCQACSACNEALADARRRLATLRAAPATLAPEALVQSTLRKVDAYGQARRLRWRRFVGIVGGALAASVALLAWWNVYTFNLSASPYDLVVLGQRDLLASTDGSLRVLLRDAGTLAPMADVPVTVRLFDRLSNQTAELATVTTDAHGVGEPRFAVPDWASPACELRVVAQTPGSPETVAQKVSVKRSFQVMLSTDKPVYQPGQVIHARALALRRPDLHPVADQTATFSVVDPKGNVVFKQEGKTSRYGITAADCPLDSEITEGPYAFFCKTADVESRVAVEVKKYVLPKFKVVVTPDKPFYKPGDAIKLTVQADYFFGKPVADAAVDVDVTQDLLDRQPKRLSARTDAKGTVSIEYRVEGAVNLNAGQAMPDPSHIHFHVTVADSAGQKQAASAEPAVSTWPARIDVIPEAGELVAGVPNTVYVLVTRMDGTPAERVHVTLTDLTNRNPNAAARGDKADADDNGAASFEVTPVARMSVEVAAADDKGAVIARRNVAIPCSPANDFLIRTDKAVYKGGDTMKLTAVGGAGPVFADLIREGQTLLTETITMSKGQGETAVDLPADMAGTVQVVGYRIDAKGFSVRKTRVVYVRPADQVHIAATLEPGKAAYKPGERPTLHLKLTDRDGKPCPGALSLASVDEAVFSVLAQRPGMEQAFYTLEEDLMAPVYKIHAWSPDEARSERFEEALFAAASRVDTANRRNMAPHGALMEGDVVMAPVGAPFMQDTLAVQTAATTHSLVAQTYPTKVQATEELREDRLRWIKCGWVGLVIASIGACLAAFWLFSALSVLIKSLVTGYFVIPFLLLALALALPGVEYASGDKSAVGMAPSFARTTTAAAVAEAGAMAPAAARIEDVDPTKTSERPGQGLPDQPRVRSMFPETLLWKPELITDDNGDATLPLDLADSITTWRLSASAVAGDGKLGALQMPVKVFQDFFVDLNLPVALTRGDEIGVPVVVYNYLDKPQTVTLTLADDKDGWFVRTGDAEQRLELAPNEVRSVRYRLKAEKVGAWTLTVAARGEADADAVKRSIEVVPDGRRVEDVVNGTLEKPVDIGLVLPENYVPGSAKAFVKIYPSSFSQVVEGVDNIFRMPYGCFEQTSSTTYPNVLALDYLKRTGRSIPAVELKARGYIRAGYQRLLSFEVPGGGFDWFGNPPANRALTAYGVMEFTDMAKVQDVDPNMVERTRRWLMAQRRPDGSWDPETHKMHEDAVGGQNADDARLAETAYIAWALFGDPAASAEAGPTFSYLKNRKPQSIHDAHTLALVCNALLAVDEHNADAAPYLDRLEGMKHFSDGGKFAWWEQPAGARATFYGAGRSGEIETTALAALALIRADRNPETTRQALSWLTAQKDPNGTWYSTQATVLALKALLAGTGKPLAGDGERVAEVRLNGEVVQTLTIPADQADVMKTVDLSPFLKPGKQTLTVSEAHGAAIGFQSSFRYNVPDAGPAVKDFLTVQLDYDRTELAVGEQIEATAAVSNATAEAAPMVMLELPVPPGFAVSADEFAALVKPGGRVAKYQVQPRSVLLYLSGLDAGESLSVKYHLRAMTPVKAAAAGAHAYEYYDPEKQGRSPGTHFIVD